MNVIVMRDHRGYRVVRKDSGTFISEVSPRDPLTNVRYIIGLLGISYEDCAKAICIICTDEEHQEEHAKALGIEYRDLRINK